MPQDGDLRIWYATYRPHSSAPPAGEAFRIPVESQEEAAVILATLAAYDHFRGEYGNDGGIETYAPEDGWVHSCEQDDYEAGNLQLETKLRVAQIQQAVP